MRAQSSIRGLFVLALLWLFNTAHAQQPVKSVTLGTNPAGTVFYAVGGGLASVISGAAPFQAVIQPYTGTSTFLPLLDSGEIDFGIINAVEMNLAYQGPAKLKIDSNLPLTFVLEPCEGTPPPCATTKI